jgi:hypothetical protein
VAQGEHRALFGMCAPGRIPRAPHWWMASLAPGRRPGIEEDLRGPGGVPCLARPLTARRQRTR